MVYSAHKSIYQSIYRDTDVFGDYIHYARCYPCRTDEREWITVVIITIMVTLSGLLRFYQEWRSNEASQALKKMVNNKVSVFRKGSESISDINMGQLFPGDVICTLIVLCRVVVEVQSVHLAEFLAIVLVRLFLQKNIKLRAKKIDTSNDKRKY